MDTWIDSILRLLLGDTEDNKLTWYIFADVLLM